MDCKFISKVAKLVPVIPVLAKADSMTSNELGAFRKQVAQSLLKVFPKQYVSTLHAQRKQTTCLIRIFALNYKLLGSSP